MKAMTLDTVIKMIADYEDGRTFLLDAVTGMQDLKRELQEAIDAIKAFEDEFFEDITLAVQEAGGRHKGWVIESRNGRKIYDYSNVPDVVEAENHVKELKEYFKKAHEAASKGMMIAGEGGVELNLPEIKYGKSYLQYKREF